ncbi:hypothetical protein D3C75_1301510 [compost metagenome]
MPTPVKASWLDVNAAVFTMKGFAATPITRNDNIVADNMTTPTNNFTLSISASE